MDLFGLNVYCFFIGMISHRFLFTKLVPDIWIHFFIQPF